MSSRDDDNLDFDFFDDDATRETQGRRPRRTRRGRRTGGAVAGPRRPQLRAPHGVTPILRLIGFVAFAILIVVLLVLWGQGCSSDKKRNNYSNAMTELGTIGTNSAKIGSSLAELLTTPGLKQAELETSLGGLIQREQQDVDSATGVDVPGPLRPATDHAVEALQLRVARHAGAARHLQGDEGRRFEERDRRRREARGAGAQARCERRRLAGPVPRPGPGDACRTRASVT